MHHTAQPATPYRTTPRGNRADPRNMSFDRAWNLACHSPDAALRRVAVLHQPDILHVWIEQGHCRRTIAAMLGFKHWNKLRFWLWDRNLLTDFMDTYRAAADLFSDAALTVELASMPDCPPAVRLSAFCAPPYPSAALLRMAGRNNPDKYTPAGKLKATPASDSTPITTQFTGSWSPDIAA